MNKRGLALGIVALLTLTLYTLLRSSALAQGNPPPAAPTPLPNIVIVTATPTAPLPPETFWTNYGGNIVVALIGLVVGGILVWLLKPTFERAGNALADAGSRLLGSGRGFRRRYLKTLIEDHRCLNVGGRRTRTPVAIDLERVYVSLRAALPDEPSPSGGRGLSLGVVMGRHDRLAIVGPPGCGKTTLLAYLALTYARDLAVERLDLKEKRLPILVPLRRLAAAGAGKQAREVGEGDAALTLPGYLEMHCAGLYPQSGYFEKMLRAGRCLVLLDGLDEVPTATQRRQVSEWVDGLVTLYPDNRYVVTSRPAGYESAPLENAFSRYDVQDLTMDEVRRFVDAWYMAVELAVDGDSEAARRRAVEQSKELAVAIRDTSRIRQLVVNPLLLSIVALVHRYRAHLPDRRVDLYNECVDVLLGHWERAKGLAANLSDAEKRAVLQRLALAMHNDEVRELGRSDLEKRVQHYLPGVGRGDATGDDVATFLDEVRDRSGLLIEQEAGTYAFSHLTFQEYLAACEIAEGESEAERTHLAAQAREEWWREVLLLYAGMRDPGREIEALLDRDRESQRAGESDRPYLLLAGYCAAEAVRLEPPELRTRVLNALEEAFRASVAEVPLLQAIGMALARLRGSGVVDFFLDQMAAGEPALRLASARALGQVALQSDEVDAESILVRAIELLDHREEVHAACLVLAEMGWHGMSRVLAADRLAEVLQGLAGKSQSLLQLAGKYRNGMDAGFREAVAAVLNMTLLPVPAGPFPMGTRRGGEKYERPQHQVEVGEFYVARYPVTNAQYARFVEAVGYAPPAHWPDGAMPLELVWHPVVNVSWHDARAYAGWVGHRLPTEAEWEKAASWNGTVGRKQEWPWGSAWDPEKCNTIESGIRQTSPVGRFSPAGDSACGAADMAGNVWEWCHSLYKPYPYRVDDGREDPEAGGSRVLRGGSWHDLQYLARCACRGSSHPDGRNINIGFRVVVAPSLPS